MTVPVISALAELQRPLPMYQLGGDAFILAVLYTIPQLGHERQFLLCTQSKTNSLRSDQRLQGAVLCDNLIGTGALHAAITISPLAWLFLYAPRALFGR